MKKLTLKPDDLAVDSFESTVEEKTPAGTVEGFVITAVGGTCSCYETCGRTCKDTCGLGCGL